jgi:antitoxin CptB
MKDISTLKKEILYKSKHRGSKELDLLIGGFVEAVVEELPAKELRQLVQLLNEDDVQIFQLLKHPPLALAGILQQLQIYLHKRGLK